ncbi:DUF2339 domain-containing protein [Corynebacterium doosanense]|uniref:DUF2339 domain-containing protein n=1 Tax=Corynebacterium doosanense TaxID=1121358 RepID=UPI000570FE13|nr:DUF2339 domain-containing protein [Corynebacterium doosanense]
MQPHSGGQQEFDDDPRWDAALARLSDAEVALRDARSTLWALRRRQQPVAREAAANPYSAISYPAPPQAAPPQVAQPQQPQPVGAPIPAPAFAAHPSPIPPASPPPAPKPARVRTLTGEQLMIRAIAGSGVVITVLGVGFAVAVAIQNGWLGPLWRVLLTALLAAALVGAATVLQKRGGPPAGVNALAVTSVLTAFLLVLSLVGVLAWWSPGVGAVAFVLLWSFYLLLYRMFGWRPVALTLFVLGAGLSGLYLWTETYTFDVLIWLVVLLPFLGLGATWGEKDRLTRRWALAAVAGATVLHAVSSVFQVSSYLVAVASVVAIMVVCLRDPVDSVTGKVFGPGCALVATIAAAVLTPLGILGYLLPVVLLLVHLGVRRLAQPSAGEPAGSAEAADAFHVHSAWMLPLSLLLPSMKWVDAYPEPEGFLGTPEFTRLLVLGGFCVFLLASPASQRVLNAGLAGWLIAAAVAVLPLFDAVLGDDPMTLTTLPALGAALLCAIIIGCLFARRKSLTSLNPAFVWPLAVAGLVLSMFAVVITVVWLAHFIGGPGAMQTGYLVGHSLVSLGWMLIAAWALLGRAPIPPSWSLWVGGVLAAAAVVKLVFFDLQALTGIARALAFLACGLVLLTIVSLRSRLNTEQEVRPGPPGGTDPYTSPRP